MKPWEQHLESFVLTDESFPVGDYKLEMLNDVRLKNGTDLGLCKVKGTVHLVVHIDDVERTHKTEEGSISVDEPVDLDEISELVRLKLARDIGIYFREYGSSQHLVWWI